MKHDRWGRRISLKQRILDLGEFMAWTCVLAAPKSTMYVLRKMSEVQEWWYRRNKK